MTQSPKPPTPRSEDALRAAVVAEARTWVGTPYLHQACLKGVGVDCVGLIIGAGTAAGVLKIDPDTWRAFAAYSRAPNPARMRRGMHTFLRPIDCPPYEIPRPGSIGWFAWRADLPMHLGIVARYEGRDTMIHAHNEMKRAVEHQLDETWRCRVNSWWRFPGVS